MKAGRSYDCGDVSVTTARSARSKNCYKKARKWDRVRGGYSIYLWVGRCGAAPHTLTLFKTNIADFPTLFKTEFRLFNTLFKTFNPNIN